MFHKKHSLVKQKLSHSEKKNRKVLHRPHSWGGQPQLRAMAQGHGAALQNGAEKLHCCAHHGMENREKRVQNMLRPASSDRMEQTSRGQHQRSPGPHPTRRWLYNPLQVAHSPCVSVMRSTKCQG